MGEIYRGASRVIAWVGDTSQGMGAITFLRNMSRSIADGSVGDMTTVLGIDTLAVIRLGLQGIFASRGVTELFSNDYFTRMWMIQEISLARDIVLKHGSEEIRWSEFSICLNFIFHTVDKRFLLEAGPILGWTVNQIAWRGVKNGVLMDLIRHSMARQRVRQDELRDMSPAIRKLMTNISKPLDTDGIRRLPLEWLLGFTTDFHATNIKDKVYAVLGITQKSTAEGISPEYDDEKQSAAEVVRRVAQVALTNPDETLDHLHLAGYGYKEARISKAISIKPREYRIFSWLRCSLTKEIALEELELPSWVPEWNLSFQQKPIVEGFPYTAGILNDSTRKKIERVNGRPDQLRVSASKVGKIKKIGERFHFGSENDLNHTVFRERFRSFWENAVRMIQDIPISTYCPDTMENALWRTAFGDCLSSGIPPLDNVDLERLKSVTKALTGLEHPTPQLHQDVLKYSQTTVFELGKVLIGHRLCVTSWGYIGLVPPGTRPGDSICIIWGSATPFITRPSNRYEHVISKRGSTEVGEEDGSDCELKDDLCGGENILVGSCYIHGLMRGEISPDLVQPSMITLI